MPILRVLLAFLMALPIPLVAPALIQAAYVPLPISSEDVAHSAGETLLRLGCRRIDTAASSAGTTGDWATLDCDDTGQIRANTEMPAAIAPAATGMTVPASAPWVLAAMGCYNPVAVTMELCVGAANIAHDASASGIAPLLVGGYANAAAPTSVSADLDAVNAWFLRNGSQVTTLSAAGALIGGDATNGLDVDVTRVPTDPFGANADAASATGSISAKLRFIAATGIPITGTVTVGSHAVTNAGTFATQPAGSVAHDAAAAAVNPVLAGAYASAAAPSDVSADADSVRLWALRNGALAVQSTFAGVLATTGNGASGTGVQRVTIADNSTGVVGLAAGNNNVGDVDAIQSGTWTVQPGNTANTTPWLTTIHQGGNAAVVNGSGQLSITCANCSGSGASHVDDAAITVGTTSGAPIMGLLDDTTPDSVNEGDGGIVRMSANRNLYIQIRDNAGNERGLNIDTNGAIAAVVSASNLDVQSGGADLATEATAAAILTSTNFAAAFGTAGTADTQVMSVQGIASMTPLLVNPGTATNFGIYAEDIAHADAHNLFIPGIRRIDVAASSTSTSGDYGVANMDALGLLWTRSLDPCNGVAKTSIPINIATATTTELTAALAGASTHYYVCSIDLVAAAAQTFALTDDDSDGCGSVTSGLAGGTTAATGWSFAANGGITKGNGEGTVFKTGGTNRVLCAVTGQAAQISGSIQVVAAP